MFKKQSAKNGFKFTASLKRKRPIAQIRLRPLLSILNHKNYLAWLTLFVLLSPVVVKMTLYEVSFSTGQDRLQPSVGNWFHVVMRRRW